MNRDSVAELVVDFPVDEEIDTCRVKYVARPFVLLKQAWHVRHKATPLLGLVSFEVTSPVSLYFQA